MDVNSAKGGLARYLDAAHEALLWKLDGLSEYDLRRPLTPTGTNLLGLLKHVAWVESEYFGEVFDRPHDLGDAPPRDVPNSDLHATADETSEEIIDLFQRAWAHARATIDALDLEDEGHVPWWGEENNPVTLQRVMVHMTAEIHRHAGHADIVRELIDGGAGYRREAANLPDLDPDEWGAYRAQVQQIADRFAD